MPITLKPTLRLPDELGLLVLSHLRGADLARAQQVCQAWAPVATDALLWKARVHLEQPLQAQAPGPEQSWQGLFAANARLRGQYLNAPWVRRPAYNNGAYSSGLLRTTYQEGFWDYQRVVFWPAGAGLNPVGARTMRFAALEAAAVLDDTRIVCVTARPRHTLEVWDTQTQTRLWQQRGRASSAHAVLRCGPDTFAVAYDTGEVDTWNVSGAAPTFQLTGHIDRVNRLALLPDDRIISASSDHTARIWSLQTGARDVVLEGHREYIKNVLVLSDGTVATSSRDDTVAIWDTQTGERLHSLAHTNIVYALCEAPCGLLITGDCVGKICVWDRVSGECLRTLTLSEDCVRQMVAVDATTLFTLTDRVGPAYFEIG